MRRMIAVLATVLVVTLGADAHAQKGKAKRKATKDAVPVSAEMKEFMSRLDVDGKKTTAALREFGASVAATADMSGDLSVENPRVLKAEKKGDEDHYTMFAKTGEARRTFLIIWKDKKIQQIKHLSVEF